jgi:xanthine/uracil permease
METATDYRAAANEARDERSLRTLLSDLWRQTSTLIADEIELAKAEMNEKASQVGSGVASIATGGAILLAGLIVLLFAAVAALALVLPEESAPWLAPLIVGGVVMLIGAAVLASGRRALRAESLKPTRTIASIRRDATMAKEHVR